MLRKYLYSFVFFQQNRHESSSFYARSSKNGKMKIGLVFQRHDQGDQTGSSCAHGGSFCHSIERVYVIIMTYMLNEIHMKINSGTLVLAC